MRDDSQIRVALIGYGLAGSVFHAPLMAATEGMTIKAIVTSNSERVARARRDFPGAEVVPSVEDIWSRRDSYDLVVVASPNKFHVAQARAALQCGLACAVDKPVARTAEECRQLIDLSGRAGKAFTVFQNRRWDGDFLTVQKILSDRLLGPVTRFESRLERYRPVPRPGAWRESGTEEDAGGLLYDLGSHLIDQACMLFGEPARVYAELARLRPGVQVDDDVFVALEFRHGMRAHLWASAVARIKGPRFRVLGFHGAFEKYGLDPQEDLLRAGESPGNPGWGIDEEPMWGKLVTTSGDLTFDGKIETLPGCYERFYSILREAILGKGPVPVQPEDALITMLVIEAAMESSRTGSVVPLAAAAAIAPA